MNAQSALLRDWKSGDEAGSPRCWAGFARMGGKKVGGHAGTAMESGRESGGTYDAVFEARWTRRVRGWARGKDNVFYVKGERRISSRQKCIVKGKDDAVKEEEGIYLYSTRISFNDLCLYVPPGLAT